MKFQQTQIAGDNSVQIQVCGTTQNSKVSWLRKFLNWLFPKKAYKIDTLGKKFSNDGQSPEKHKTFGIFINRYLNKEKK